MDDGPYFSTDLVGPDGRLSRLHKGGGGSSSQLQAQAAQLAQQNRKAQRQATRQATRTARQQRQQLARQTKAFAQAQRDAAERLAQMTAEQEGASAYVPPTQYIEDEEALRGYRRGAMGAGMGISSSRALSRYGMS